MNGNEYNTVKVATVAGRDSREMDAQALVWDEKGVSFTYDDRLSFVPYENIDRIVFSDPVEEDEEEEDEEEEAEDTTIGADVASSDSEAEDAEAPEE